jgi:hypothetical protein
VELRGYILCYSIFLMMGACSQLSESAQVNPSAEGFDLAHSDPAAVELADSIMVAMGGWENWKNTRFISWSFSDSRNLFWDKKKDRVRIESVNDSITYIVGLQDVKGKVWIKGQSITNKDSLSKMLNHAKSIWAHDSYWLVMPFKLKDNGVTLKYLGEDMLQTGDRCNVLQLIKSSGDIQNKYHLYVDLSDNLVKQWAFYESLDQDSANFVRPWDNYKKYGDILLSADRSDDFGPRNVKVSNVVNESFFEDL